MTCGNLNTVSLSSRSEEGMGTCAPVDGKPCKETEESGDWRHTWNWFGVCFRHRSHREINNARRVGTGLSRRLATKHSSHGPGKILQAKFIVHLSLNVGMETTWWSCRMFRHAKQCSRMPQETENRVMCTQYGTNDVEWINSLSRVFWHVSKKCVGMVGKMHECVYGYAFEEKRVMLFSRMLRTKICGTSCCDTWQLILVMTRGNLHFKQITSQFSQHGRSMAIEYVDST